MEPITMTIGLLTLGLDAGTLIHDRMGRDETGPPPTDVGSVPGLWDRFQNGEIGVDDRVQVSGSLTDHGPMIFGHSREVKETHFRMRDRLTRGEEASVDPGTLDGLISMSSGNPLVRVAPERGVQYAGLYEGIGRNSLPVFVDADAYGEWSRDHDGAVRDARLTGTLRRVPEQWRDLVSAFGVDADHGIALFVESDGIEDDGETAFFEADIWAVYETDGERRWVSRCPDFARRNELRKDVRTVADAAGEEVELVAQFDMADEPISRKLGVSPSPSYMQESANEQIRQEYLKRIRDLVDA